MAATMMLRRANLRWQDQTGSGQDGECRRLDCKRRQEHQGVCLATSRRTVVAVGCGRSAALLTVSSYCRFAFQHSRP